MNRTSKIIFSAAAALIVGCAHHNHATTQPSMAADTGNVSTETASTATATPATAAPAPTVAPAKLAGTWQLAIPRQGLQTATVTATDDTHVTIAAGDSLSGNYVVKGEYLLILTRDESKRPLAWRINSADSITVVRSSTSDDNSADFTGSTLVRSAQDSTASAAEPSDEKSTASTETAQPNADKAQASTDNAAANSANTPADAGNSQPGKDNSTASTEEAPQE